MKNVATTALFAAAVALSAIAADAATVTTDRVQPTFTGLLGAPTSASANFRLNFQGSDLVAPVPNSRTPWEEFSGLADTAYYNSVEGGGFAEYVFDAPQTSFSLMWGSPDSYNKLQFFLADASVFSISGNNASITGTPGFVANRKFVNVTISDLSFDKVRFTSGNTDAFEYANVAPVPLPAAAWMLLSAFGGMGLLARRRTA